ncbi:MAG: hypothetical protein AAB391_00530 [Patescibacteria group bacterium]
MNAIIYHTNQLTKNELFIQRVCIAVLALIFCSALSYGYMINATIGNVVARQKAQSSITKLSAELATLETTHLQLKNNIGPSLAVQLGFVDVADPHFVSYNQSQSLSLNTPR